jgi:hypothetical protein
MGENQTKTEIVVSVVRLISVAIRRARVVVIVVPRAAALSNRLTLLKQGG